jgi:Mrp family chromosome partitioning ATPase
MSKYAVVLEKASPHADLLAPRRVLAPASSSRASGQRAYAELSAKLFRAAGPVRVVAFASVNPGEGVTRTVRGLAAELVRSGRTVGTLDGALHGSYPSDMSLSDEALRIEPAILGAPRAAEPETAATFIANLRERYDCLLLDCGSIESSTDLLRLASLSDGVVMVVEAGRTGKDQINHAARVIREAQGTLLGCVLNKRRYPIPEWLYRLL